MQFKNIDLTEFEVKFIGDVATIEGYASTFGNVDSDSDVVKPGAFKDSIQRTLPKMLYQHDIKRIPGVWEKASEDSKGLIVVGKTLNTTLGRDVAEEVRSGAINTMSIGYSPVKSSFDKQTSVRNLEQVKLHEVSLVTFPANEQAIITRVKAAHDNERDFEDFLREAGYSRDAAKIITARGFKALSIDQREADDAATRREAEAKGLAHLNALLTQFTKELSL
jgi:HK97 family phage prohead protease